MRFVIVLSLASAALAQTSSPSSTGVITGTLGQVPMGVISSGAWTSATVGPGMPGGAVTGVPYSAEQVTEHVQTLADGTHITQPSQKAMFYRDSQGRTRIEHTFRLPPGAAVAGDVAPGLVEINDPVAGAHYTLDARARTAHKFSFPSATPSPAPNSTSASGRLLSLQPASRAAVAQRSAASDGQEQRPQFSHESLGTQTIEGILAEGTRTTILYPIGFFGNDRPMTTVSETWMSSELKTVVLSKNSDPRNGESTTKLTNISRLEPDPSLFQVPPDYEIVDAQATGPNR